MLPASRNVTIYKGDTFNMTVKLLTQTADGLPGVPVDLTGATPKAQVRPDFDSSTVIATMTCTMDAANGIVYLEIPAATTATMTGGVYDFQLTFPDGRIRTFVAGTVTLTKQVTV